MLERWPHVCRVKMTFWLLQSTWFISQKNELHEILYKVETDFIAWSQHAVPTHQQLCEQSPETYSSAEKFHIARKILNPAFSPGKFALEKKEKVE